MSINPNLQPPDSGGAPSPSTGSGGAPGTPGTGINIPSAQALAQALTGILSTGDAQESSNIAALQQSADSILSSGPLTTDELTQLQQQAEADINEPNLSPPDQLKVNLFLAKVLTLKIQMGFSGPTGGVIPAAGGNRFLDDPAIVELFEVLSKISVEQTKIKFQESQVKISMAKMTIEIAKDIAQLIIEMGNVAAAQSINQASDYMAQGLSALGQAALSAVTIAMTQANVQKGIDKTIQDQVNTAWNADKNSPQFMEYRTYLYDQASTSGGGSVNFTTIGPPTADNFPDYAGLKTQFPGPSGTDLLKIETDAIQRAQLTMQPYTSMLTGATNLAQSALKVNLAEMQKENSVLEAAKSQLQTLLDMIKSTSDTLAKDIDDIKSSIQKLCQMFEQAAQIYAQLGSGRGG